MEIKDIDSNFKNESVKKEKKIIYYSLPNEKFSLYGIYYDDEEKRFRRFPNEVALGMQQSESAISLSTHTCGGRIKFATNSSTIIIKAQWKDFLKMSNMPFTGSAGFVLCEQKEETEFHIATINPEWWQLNESYKEISVKGDRIRNYILYFPLYNGVDFLEIGLEDGAVIEQGTQYKKIKPILYYGSSITQGGCASRPDNMYPALISKWNNVDYINMGVSGHARAEESMIKYLKTIDCSIFVYDYDHNADTLDYLKQTHHKLYCEIRKAKKDIPIIMISCPDIERYDKEGERAEIIYESFLQAQKEGDKNVYFINGKELFGKTNRENCVIDGTHPNDLGFYRMAKCINKTIRELLFKIK